MQELDKNLNIKYLMRWVATVKSELHKRVFGAHDERMLTF